MIESGDRETWWMAGCLFVCTKILLPNKKVIVKGLMKMIFTVIVYHGNINDINASLSDTLLAGLTLHLQEHESH